MLLIVVMLLKSIVEDNIARPEVIVKSLENRNKKTPPCRQEEGAWQIV
jgi:hypothetical protein